MRKPFLPNNYCPCGSNLKYKKCCWPRGVEYYVKPGGEIVKHEPLSAEQRAWFDEQNIKFRQTYGRDPSEEEEAVMRLTGYADVPSLIVEDLLAKGAPPEVVYAFKRTGVLVTPENQSRIGPEELSNWFAALEEYANSSEDLS